MGPSVEAPENTFPVCVHTHRHVFVLRYVFRPCMVHWNVDDALELPGGHVIHLPWIVVRGVQYFHVSPLLLWCGDRDISVLLAKIMPIKRASSIFQSQGDTWKVGGLFQSLGAAVEFPVVRPSPGASTRSSSAVPVQYIGNKGSWTLPADLFLAVLPVCVSKYLSSENTSDDSTFLMQHHATLCTMQEQLKQLSTGTWYWHIFVSSHRSAPRQLASIQS